VKLADSHVTLREVVLREERLRLDSREELENAIPLQGCLESKTNPKGVVQIPPRKICPIACLGPAVRNVPVLAAGRAPTKVKGTDVPAWFVAPREAGHGQHEQGNHDDDSPEHENLLVFKTDQAINLPGS